jgi:hypothetical protein
MPAYTHCACLCVSRSWQPPPPGFPGAAPGAPLPHAGAYAAAAFGYPALAPPPNGAAPAAGGAAAHQLSDLLMNGGGASGASTGAALPPLPAPGEPVTGFPVVGYGGAYNPYAAAPPPPRLPVQGMPAGPPPGIAVQGMPHLAQPQLQPPQQATTTSSGGAVPGYTAPGAHPHLGSTPAATAVGVPANSVSPGRPSQPSAGGSGGMGTTPGGGGGGGPSTPGSGGGGSGSMLSVGTESGGEPEFLASIFNDEDGGGPSSPRHVPSPPPLPDDFHTAAAAPNRLLFNFSQFNQKMPQVSCPVCCC